MLPVSRAARLMSQTRNADWYVPVNTIFETQTSAEWFRTPIREPDSSQPGATRTASLGHSETEREISRSVVQFYVPILRTPDS